MIEMPPGPAEEEELPLEGTRVPPEPRYLNLAVRGTFVFRPDAWAVFQSHKCPTVYFRWRHSIRYWATIRPQWPGAL